VVAFEIDDSNQREYRSSAFPIHAREYAPTPAPSAKGSGIQSQFARHWLERFGHHPDVLVEVDA
jgi:hypothetical protein